VVEEDGRTRGDLRSQATCGQLGVQLCTHRHAEIAKRIDIAAAAIHHKTTGDAMSKLDLSWTPSLASRWDAIQAGSQAWVRELQASQPNRPPSSDSV
jgi:hypothetical protein